MTRARQGQRRPSRGVSVGVFIASLFVGSAGFRILDPGAAAIAQEAVSYIKERTQASGEPSAGSSDMGKSGAALAQELQDRKRDLESRETALALREQELSLLREQVEQRIEALRSAESDLESLVNTASKLAAADVENLTAVYANMKPKRAGALFEKMEPAFAAGFLRGMPPEAASLILTEMSAESAYALSVVLAGQHQDIPQ